MVAYLPHEDKEAWFEYIKDIQQKNEIDHIVLLAIANVQQIKVVVLKAEGKRLVISPYSCKGEQELVLGHIGGHQFLLLAAGM